MSLGPGRFLCVFGNPCDHGNPGPQPILDLAFTPFYMRSSQKCPDEIPYLHRNLLDSVPNLSVSGLGHCWRIEYMKGTTSFLFVVCLLIMSLHAWGQKPSPRERLSLDA